MKITLADGKSGAGKAVISGGNADYADNLY